MPINMFKVPGGLVAAVRDMEKACKFTVGQRLVTGATLVNWVDALQLTDFELTDRLSTLRDWARDLRQDLISWSRANNMFICKTSYDKYT